MEVRIKVESTPNPNAKKFITSVTVINQDRISYGDASECRNNPLGMRLFNEAGVTQIHFFENVVTITQDGSQAWDMFIESIKALLVEHLPAHDPNLFDEDALGQKETLTGEMKVIDAIIDKSIRPYLQGDGGDIELLELEGKILRVKYQGACGSCPSSTMGTLSAIEGMLRDEYDPEIEVHAM
jgi:Fe-S cluster biogenesis protein NfuA